MSFNNNVLAVGIMAAGMLAASGVQANTVVSRDFSGNDCSGYFGTGFDSCTIFVNDGGQQIELSPVIAKYNGGDLTLSATNGTLYPSVDGTEFSFSNTVTGNKTGDWAYSPGIDDPGVKYWAAKAGNGFRLFWDVDASATATGGACDVSDLYTLACLNEALTVSSGSWTTPGNKDLSHITFYDSEPPTIVPVPAAVWLFGSGLLGLVGIARRRRA